MIVLLPFWTLAVMFTLWYYKGRDPDPGRSVAPMYEPPKDMTPAESGTLLDDSLDPRDITSTLIDLAVRGYVKIEQIETPGLFRHGKDYVFHLLKPSAEWRAWRRLSASCWKTSSGAARRPIFQLAQPLLHRHSHHPARTSSPP